MVLKFVLSIAHQIRLYQRCKYVWTVFPLQGKIRKPGFWVAEEKNTRKPDFGGFWNKCNFAR